MKTTFDAGYLVPIFLDEALPGDTFNLNMTGFARLATPLHPFMDNVFMNTFFFAVPMRLVWDNWVKMMGEQTNPGDSTDYVTPQIVSPAGGYGESSLYDYFGLPTKVAGFSHSALPLRAYALIWNEWFRDQNLQAGYTVPKGDGPDDPNLYPINRRGKRHDYFTSALPWPQKGPGVDILLGTRAPIAGLGVYDNQAFVGSGVAAIGTAAGLTVRSAHPASPAAPVSSSRVLPPVVSQPVIGLMSMPTSRRLRPLQSISCGRRFKFRSSMSGDARGGTRYTEIIRAHFNVVSPDARLQRPEYLGGGQSYVNLHTVPQTSASDPGPTPQGNLAAYGTASLTGMALRSHSPNTPSLSGWCRCVRI